jgi:signal transduction histidine kinase
MDRVRTAWRRYLDSPLRDVVLAVAVTVVLLIGSYGEAHPTSTSDKILFPGHEAPHTPLAALLLVAVAGLALAWRRRYPVTVLAVSTAAAASYTLLGYVNGAVLLAPILALYAVATRVSVRRAVAAAVVTVAVLIAATAARNPFGQITGGGTDLIPFLGAAALFAGIAVASRRAYVASIHDRAQEEARRRIDEERLRIARELHDVVAHTMATINVQAGAAAHVLPARPEVAAEALQAIKAASKEGLRELRAILNVLRQADDADPTQPAPGAAQLATLVDGARRAGLETTLSVTGTPVPLPAPVDLAAYRIVQESLTNTIRHAGPATAAVSLSYGHDELRIDVADTGLGQPAGPVSGSTGTGGTGHGPAGMRERAAAVGGSVEAGPSPGGGYRVAARLPLHGPLAGEPAPVPAGDDTTSRRGAVSPVKGDGEAGGAQSTGAERKVQP